MSPNSDSTTQTAADSPSLAAGVDPDADVEVPEGAESHACEYCGRPFPAADLLVLHRGLAHPDRLDDDEVERFRATYRSEGEAIDRFRIAAVGVLVLLYFGFLFVYIFVT
jgi:hypothetical protein